MKRGWKSLDVELSKEILSTLKKNGFKEPTPVQASAIPWLLKYKDVVAEAVTGSGKTLAFVIPMLELMKRRTEPWKSHQVGAIIISPTAELAEQIYHVVNTFLPAIHKSQKSLSESASSGGGEVVPLTLHLWSAGLFVGASSSVGKKLHEDVTRFESAPEGCNIIVATPGRLCDLLKVPSVQRAIKSLELLVLDEADRLLDMGFKTQLDLILRALPKQRRTGLFSATQTESVEDLIRAGLRNPVRVNVKEKSVVPDHDSKTPVSLQKYFMVVESEKKLHFLIHFLRQFPDRKILIFFSTVHCVRYFACLLQRILKKRPVLAIHSMMRKQRSKVYEKYQASNNAILVASDVASRGIDFPKVDWVILYDPPKTAADYVHRCGRTARTGTSGRALLLLRPSESVYVPFLEKNQQVRLKELPAPENIPDLQEQLKRRLLKDKFLVELSVRAFVSFIQFYTKQECSRGVMNLNDLEIGKLATSFVLLRLPKMPELRDRDTSGFTPTAVDLDKLPILDKSIRKQREKLEAEKKLKEQTDAANQQLNTEKVKKKSGSGASSSSKVGKDTVSWSKVKKQKERRKQRRNMKMKAERATTKS